MFNKGFISDLTEKGCVETKQEEIRFPYFEKKKKNQFTDYPSHPVLIYTSTFTFRTSGCLPDTQLIQH